MKEHAKSLRRKRIGRPRFVFGRGGGGRDEGARTRTIAPKVFGSGPPTRWIAVLCRKEVPPMAADATRLETRTTEPFVPGETTARETPVSQGSRRFFGDRREVA